MKLHCKTQVETFVAVVLVFVGVGVGASLAPEYTYTSRMVRSRESPGSCT